MQQTTFFRCGVVLVAAVLAACGGGGGGPDEPAPQLQTQTTQPQVPQPLPAQTVHLPPRLPELLALPALPSLPKAVLHTLVVPAVLPPQPVQPMDLPSDVATRQLHGAAAYTASMWDLIQGRSHAETLVLGGNVSGLVGTLELRNHMLEDERLVITSDGEFVFPTRYDRPRAMQGNRYSVSVSRQPGGQHCTVSAAGGNSFTHVFNLRVTCSSAQVSTLAGSGSQGQDDGVGVDASFDHPYGIAIDGHGELLVADWGSQQVRRISRAGQVASLAHGIAHPTAVGVDSIGNVYVASPGHGAIRQLIPAGGELDLYPVRASTMTGQVGVEQYYLHAEGLYRFASGLLSRLTTEGWQSSYRADVALISFSDPEGIAADGRGNVYVSETAMHRILKITPGGQIFTLAGSGEPGADDKPGAEATFNYPSGLALDPAGNLLVADTQNHLVRRITPRGEVSTLAGKALASGTDDGIGGQARFLRPRGVAFGADGAVYVADTGNHLIRKINLKP